MHHDVNVLNVLDGAEAPLTSAREYDAGTAATFVFCTSYYIGSPLLAEETATADELRAMLEEKVLRHITVGKVPPDVDRRDVVAAISSDPAWQLHSNAVTIDGLFMDGLTACLAVDADGKVVADHDSANELAKADPKKFATGRDLEQRAALCTMQPDGRLVVPSSSSNDIRLVGAKKLDKQMNRKTEVMRHDLGWTLALVTVAEYGRGGGERSCSRSGKLAVLSSLNFPPSAADHERTHLPENRHLELSLHRRHLHPSQAGLDGDNTQEYAVYKSVVLTVGHEMDIVMTLAEVPPDEVPVPEAACECLWRVGGARGREACVCRVKFWFSVKKITVAPSGANIFKRPTLILCFKRPTLTLYSIPTATTIKDQRNLIFEGLKHSRTFASQMPRLTIPDMVCLRFPLFLHCFGLSRLGYSTFFLAFQTLFCIRDRVGLWTARSLSLSPFCSSDRATNSCSRRAPRLSDGASRCRASERAGLAEYHARSLCSGFLCGS